MNFQKINELLQKAIFQMNDGNFASALDIANEINNLGSHFIISYYVSGLYIDIGSAIHDEDLVNKGVKILEIDFNKIVQDEKQAQTAFYNLGNGYSCLFKFKQLNNLYYALFKETELDKAIYNYRKALSFNIHNKMLASQIWVNLGNCYDMSGRFLDALECYEAAIKLNPQEGMALGNKGIALSNFAEIITDHQITFLIEAHNLISNALEMNVYPEVKNDFIYYLDYIRKRLPDSTILEKPLQLPGYKIQTKNEFEKFLIEFCLKNRLYLNVCNYCQMCDACIGDTVLITNMIMSIEEDLFNNAFLCLSSYLNEIKQDYISARFLLIFALYDGIKIEWVDKRVRLIDTFKEDQFNIRIQLIKYSFKSLYDILDKLAYFLNDYLSLKIPEKKVSFHKLWYSNKNELTNKIKLSNNSTLNAIYKIHKDFETEEYKKLKNTRDALTHRYLKIKKEEFNETSEKMTKKTLLNQTLKLANVVRNVIIYAIYCVELEERKKVNKNSLFAVTAKEIKDEEKNN